MKNHTQQKISNLKTLDQHPFFFGHFLNMARHNAYVILTDLFEKFDYKKNVKEENLSGALSGCYKQIKKMVDKDRKLTEGLKKKFPFLKCAGKKDKNDIYQEPTSQEVIDLLKQALESLNTLRNQYTHAAHPISDKKVFPLREIFNYTVTEKMLPRYIDLRAEDIRHLIRDKKNVKPYKYQLHESNIAYTEKGLAYFICFFLNPQYAFSLVNRLESIAKESPKQKTVTARCFTMNCCRLPRPKLESADITLDMLNELGKCSKELYGYFSQEDKDKFIAKFDNSNEQLSSENEEDSFSNQTVMHRNKDRFPYFALRYFDDMECFDRLRFQLQLGKWIDAKYLKKIDGEDHDRLRLKPIRVFGRWGNFTKDKVPHYWKSKKDEHSHDLVDPERIDQFAPHYNFSNNTIPLKILNNEEQKKEHIFPSFVDKKKKEIKAGENSQTIFNTPADAVLSTHQLQGLFLYHHLHKNYPQHLSTSAEDCIQNYINNFRQLIKDVQNGSLVPLVVPAFYTRSKHGKFKKPELEKLREHLEFLKESIPSEDRDKIKRFKQADLKKSEARLKEVEKYESSKLKMETLLWEKYSIHLKDLPDVIREYLTGFKADDFYDIVRQRIDFFKKDTEEKIAEFEKDTTGKLKDGRIATWLAEDIVRLKKHQEDGKGMPNKDQYNVLQAKLALYPGHVNTLKNYFKEIKMIGNGEELLNHPFLNQIEPTSHGSTLKFYKAYLDKRLEWFTTSLPRTIFKVEEFKDRKGRKKKKITKKPQLNQKNVIRRYHHYLNIRRLQAKSKNYKNIPVNLPSGFFNEPVFEALSKIKTLQPDPNCKTKPNVTWCLQQFLEEESQLFYTDYKRYLKVYPEPERDKKGEIISRADRDDYDLMEKDVILREAKAEVERLRNFKKRDDEAEKDYRQNKSRLNQILAKEQRIRRTQSNDRALWIMARERIKKEWDQETDLNEFPLKNIGFNFSEKEQTNNILNHEVPMKLKFYLEHQDKEVAIVDIKSVKKYGDFRRFLKDPRIKNLLDYKDGKKDHNSIGLIPKEEVEAEMEEYNKRRERFFEVVYQFEEEVYEKLNHLFPPLAEQKDGIYKHQTYLDVLAQYLPKAKHPSIGFLILGELRNKFLHNQILNSKNKKGIITYEVYSKFRSQLNRKSLVKSMFDVAEASYNKLIQNLRNEN